MTIKGGTIIKKINSETYITLSFILIWIVISVILFHLFNWEMGEPRTCSSRRCLNIPKKVSTFYYLSFPFAYTLTRFMIKLFNPHFTIFIRLTPKDVKNYGIVFVLGDLLFFGLSLFYLNDLNTFLSLFGLFLIFIYGSLTLYVNYLRSISKAKKKILKEKSDKY